MKQVVLNNRSGNYEVLDLPQPVSQPERLLVRTQFSLLSSGTERLAISFAGKNLLQKAASRPELARQVFDKIRREGLTTTIAAVQNRLSQPQDLGYSSAGRVLAVGAGVRNFKVGDYVACAGGGHATHAEVVSIPPKLAVNLSAFSAEPSQEIIEGAAFVALGGIALHGIHLARLGLGETAAVIGLGLVGQLTVQLLKAAGCRVMAIDPDAERFALARKLGADFACSDPGALREAVDRVTGGIGADAVLITAGTDSDQPLQLAAEVARDRSVVVAVGAVGLRVPRKIFYEKELELRISRSYGPGRHDSDYEEKGRDYPVGYVRWTENRNLEAFIRLLCERKLDLQSLITHRFPIEEGSRAYDLILGKPGIFFLAVLLRYPGETSEPSPLMLDSSAHVSRPGRVLDTVGIGVLGAGNFAVSTLLPALRKTAGARMVGLVAAHGSTSRYAASRFGFAYCSTSERDILADSNVDAVFILTRHHLHGSQVIAALDAGKHVFVEKPLAVSAEDCTQLERRLSTVNDQLLMVGFNRRFSPMSQRFRDFLREGKEPINLHYRVNAGYIPPNHWVHELAEGGRLIGEGCHFIDYCNWVIGEAPRTVSVRALPNVGRYCDDNLVIVLEYPNGSLGVITYVAAGDRSTGKERVEGFCGGRTAILDDYWRLLLAHDGRRQNFRSRFQQDKGHTGECADFVSAIRQASPSPIPVSEILATTSATIAAADSLRRGEPVTVPLPSVGSSFRA